MARERIRCHCAEHYIFKGAFFESDRIIHTDERCYGKGTMKTVEEWAKDIESLVYVPNTDEYFKSGLSVEDFVLPMALKIAAKIQADALEAACRKLCPNCAAFGFECEEHDRSAGHNWHTGGKACEAFKIRDMIPEIPG